MLIGWCLESVDRFGSVNSCKEVVCRWEIDFFFENYGILDVMLKEVSEEG